MRPLPVLGRRTGGWSANPRRRFPIQALFLLVLAAAVIAWARLLLGDLRAGLFVGTVFMSLALEALPWRMLPVPGLAIAILLGLCSVAIMYNLRSTIGRKYHPAARAYFLGMLVLAGLLAGYAAISPTAELGASKTLLFLIRVIVPVVAIASFGTLSPDLVALAPRTLIIAGALLALSILGFGSLEAERATGDATVSPITTGRIAGLAALLAFDHYVTARSGGLLQRVVRVLAVFAFLGATAVSGSRGPVVAAIAAPFLLGLLIGVPSSWRGRMAPRMIPLALMALLVAILLRPQLERLGGAQRVLSTVGTLGQNRTERTRLGYYRDAVNQFVVTNGLGAGTGSFGRAAHEPGRSYPHNLFLELAAELGLVGLAVGGFLCAVVLARLRGLHHRHSLPPAGVALGLAWFYALLNAQVSGDLPGNQPLWILGMLVCLVQDSPGPSSTRS